MSRVGKYEFVSKAEADLELDSLGFTTDEEGNKLPTHGHTVVRLGNIVVTPGTYDEEGVELTAPVLSDKYHVDILWSKLPMDEEGKEIFPKPEWETNMIVLDNEGVHSFLGCMYCMPEPIVDPEI